MVPETAGREGQGEGPRLRGEHWKEKDDKDRKEGKKRGRGEKGRDRERGWRGTREEKRKKRRTDKKWMRGNQEDR